jgi:F-type H+-transporting ATPase subunit epsilon
LVKTGDEVTVAVRNAVGGAALGQLRQAVEREFSKLHEREKAARLALAKLEITFVRRFLELRHA